MVLERKRLLSKSEKALWVGALRSGEYKQGKQLLKSANRYCCLGVLCEAVLKLPQREFGTSFPTRTTFHFSDVPGEWEHASMIPQEFVKCEQTELAEMNDSGESFDLIAQWIEDNVKTWD